jgi:hypothetical protein
MLQSILGGSVCVARLFTHLSEEDNGSSQTFVADDTQKHSTLEFALGPEDQAYLLLPFNEAVQLRYVVQSKDNTRISISTIKYGGEVSDETAYTVYPELSQQQIDSAAGTHTIPAGTGEYMLRFENESVSGPVPVLQDGSTAEVRYDFQITAV